MARTAFDIPKAIAISILAATIVAGPAPAAQGGGQVTAAGEIHPQLWPRQMSPIARDARLEAFIDDVLRRMTVEEKVGQIIQADITAITPEDLLRYPLGAILNGGNQRPGGDSRAAPQAWLALADAFYDAAKARGGTYVPLLWGTDAVHGHNNIPGATIFPHNIALGATRDPDLVRRIGAATAAEIAVTGQDWTFAPTVAVAQDARWGRTYESYSSDPTIVAGLGAALVEGLQGSIGSDGFLRNGHVLATAKHFLGDGGTTGGKDQGDADASETVLRDVHAAGYVATLAAGVQTVMASFSSWRGQKMHGNRALLTDVLKSRMGFDGFVIGDWDGHAQVPGCSKDSCPAAINAGLDMFMAPDRWKDLYANTLAQAKAGRIPMDRLDDAVRRILRVKARAGLFDAPRPSERAGAGKFDLLGSAEHRALARQAVRESLVLLKNDGGILPLRRDARVLVTGNGADDIGRQSGGWTLSWQGQGNTNADFPHGQSIFAGIREAVTQGGGTAALSSDGRFADKPDAAIVVFGETPYAEGKGDRRSLDYSVDDQQTLEALRRLNQAGIPTVSIFLSGRPLQVDPEIAASRTFVAAWLPGTEGGGVADLLFRERDGSIVNDFRGRLPFPWPGGRSAESDAAAFPIGYGLGYSAGGSDASSPAR